MLILSLVRAKLLAFLEEVVDPRPAQQLDVASLGRCTEGLRTLETAT
jgi:hypothetical protein